MKHQNIIEKMTIEAEKENGSPEILSDLAFLQSFAPMALTA